MVRFFFFLIHAFFCLTLYHHICTCLKYIGSVYYTFFFPPEETFSWFGEVTFFYAKDKSSKHGRRGSELGQRTVSCMGTLNLQVSAVGEDHSLDLRLESPAGELCDLRRGLTVSEHQLAHLIKGKEYHLWCVS